MWENFGEEKLVNLANRKTFTCQLLHFKPGVRRPSAHAWFLRIVSVRECLYVCVCVFAYACLHVRVVPPPRLLITSGVMWCDIDPI